MSSNFELFICGSQIRSMSTEAAVAMQEFNTSYTVEVMACTQAGCGVKSPRRRFFVPAIGENLTWNEIPESLPSHSI